MAVERAANIRVGIAQIGTAPISTDYRHIRDNTDKIIASLQKARSLPNEKLDLLVFPELAIPSYLSKDFFNRRDYLHANKEALKRIVPETIGITAIVGFADYDETKLGPDGRMMRYNSAAVIRDGEIVGVIDKTHLPKYGPFGEGRYFSAPREEHTGYNNIIEVNGKKIGIQICEDIWQNGPDVTKHLKDNGAEMVVNLSASPFYIDRFNDRLEHIKRKSNEHDLTIVFANTVGAQEHLVFDGQSMVVRKGELVAKGKAFEEDFVIFDSADQRPEIVVPPVKEEEQIYKVLVMSMKAYFEKVKREKRITKAVIGLSGGIDSAVTAALAVEALGQKNVIGVALPSLPSSERSVIDAEELANRLGIEFKKSSIIETYKSELEAARRDFGREPDSLDKQNMQQDLEEID
jgi:NAD+ synthase (glutamine-hydrolysing)